MASIQEYLDLIKNAIYGKDVRQAIHDGIQQCYYDGKAGSTDLEARQRLDSAEGSISSLGSRMSTAEGDIDTLDANITSLTSRVPEIVEKDGWRIVQWPDGYVEASKVFSFSSVANYATLAGGYGGYQITGIILPYKMQDYQVSADVKIETAFSMYAGANKFAGSFDMIMWATTTGAQAIKAWVTIAGYKE